LAGRDYSGPLSDGLCAAFLLTRPSRDVTFSQFLHAITSRKFLLTRPSRDVTCARPMLTVLFEISTHTSLAGRDFYSYFITPRNGISTHTSLAGRDIWHHVIHYFSVISTHTSLAGRDKPISGYEGLYEIFLLTRPSRDVTGNVGDCTVRAIFLLTRPSRDVTSR